MSTFKAVVTEEVKANRLLSLVGGNGMLRISVTEPGGNPDFRSSGDLKEDMEVNVNLKNNPVWDVEAGEDLSAGAYVEVGEGGVLVASESTGIGYVAEGVNSGQIAKLVRQAGGGSGEQGPPGPEGPQGPKGDKGNKGDKGDSHFTEEEAAALKELINDGESE
ncbi:hypothetical protein [Oceanobacillus jeddahense]|uniref:hypothetical protein n=1 Tax=Oceanobacillus jeddahense TaxID=1462527 RepID=UPI0005961AF4|nr:hypothetical protein [Oceanobacillus jeddahense]